MINIDPQVQPEPEPEGYEFSYYAFDPLPALEVYDIQMSSAGSTQDDDTTNYLCNLPIGDKVLTDLQKGDEFCKNILKQIEKGNLLKNSCNLWNSTLVVVED